jgi:hypothetical protein
LHYGWLCDTKVCTLQYRAKILAAVALAAALVFFPALIIIANGLIGPPPNWDVVVAKGSDCQLSDHPPTRNHNGIVAILRDANCPGEFAQGTSYEVIFVHRADEANTSDNLAFQYTPGFEGNTLSPLPALVWKSSTLLEVTAPGVIEDIKVQKTDVSGIRLSYRLSRRLSILDYIRRP